MTLDLIARTMARRGFARTLMNRGSGADSSGDSTSNVAPAARPPIAESSSLRSDVDGNRSARWMTSCPTAAPWTPSRRRAAGLMRAMAYWASTTISPIDRSCSSWSPSVDASVGGGGRYAAAMTRRGGTGALGPSPAFATDASGMRARLSVRR